MRLLDCERNVVGYAVLVMQCVRCYAHVWAVLCRVVPCCAVCVHAHRPSYLTGRPC